MSYFIDNQFDLNNYIVEDYCTNTFENANVTDSILNQVSFPPPPETIIAAIQDNYFAPPSSPPQQGCTEPVSDERVAILIPDDDDDDFYINRLDSPTSPQATTVPPLTDIQTILDYPKECLLTASYDNKTFYTIPPLSAADARHIWIHAHIPRQACIQDIEYLLLDWAYTYAHLEISDRRVKHIAWPTSSNCICQATWPAFLRWIICATPTGISAKA